MVYEDIMTPIEMLSNSNRLPALTSPIYEPNLVASRILYTHEVSEYSEWVNNVNQDNLNDLFIREYSIDLKEPEHKELLSEPLEVCQFHVIEV